MASSARKAMFARSTEFQIMQALALAKLRANRGVFHCSNCLAMFDALERVSETKEICSTD